MTSTGGRFPSDLNISRTRDFDAPQSPSSESSDRDTINAVPAVVPIIQTNEPARKYSRDDEDPYRLKGIASHSPGMTPAATTAYDDDQARYMANPQPYAGQQAVQDQSFFLPGQQHLNQPPASAYQQQPIQQQPIQQQQPAQRTFDGPNAYERNQSSYGDWMAPAAIGAGAGIAGTAAYNHYKQDDNPTSNNNEPDLQQQAAQEAAQIDDSGHEANSAAAPINTFPVAPISTFPAAANDAPTREIAAPPALSTPTYTTPSTATNPSVDTQVAGNGPNGTYLSYNSPTGSGLAGTSDTPVSPMAGGLGGLESRGAHETGHIFPSVVRHNTDISVSQLHVPGEFPKRE
jgi:hypothetical protein